MMITESPCPIKDRLGVVFLCRSRKMLTPSHLSLNAPWQSTVPVNALTYLGFFFDYIIGLDFVKLKFCLCKNTHYENMKTPNPKSTYSSQDTYDKKEQSNH